MVYENPLCPVSSNQKYWESLPSLFGILRCFGVLTLLLEPPTALLASPPALDHQYLAVPGTCLHCYLGKGPGLGLISWYITFAQLMPGPVLCLCKQNSSWSPRGTSFQGDFAQVFRIFRIWLLNCSGLPPNGVGNENAAPRTLPVWNEPLLRCCCMSLAFLLTSCCAPPVLLGEKAGHWHSAL